MESGVNILASKSVTTRKSWRRVDDFLPISKMDRVVVRHEHMLALRMWSERNLAVSRVVGDAHRRRVLWYQSMERLYNLT